MSEFLSVKQVAERFGKSEETVKRWLRLGKKFPNAVKHSDKQGWMIPVTDIANEYSVPLVQENVNGPLFTSDSDNNEKELVTLAYQVGTMTHPTKELINILSFVGIKRTLELLLVLRQSPTRVKNPVAFLKKAIQEGWEPGTVPQKIERKQAVRKPTRTEIIPEWFNKTEKVKPPQQDNELSTDKLLEIYDVLKKLSESGNKSAKEQINSVLVELEKRGVSI